ncbi:EEF1A lysine methyltransferase 3 [Seminavis robusta]|uniref:EEF1A lysine methyltransferase 3 n=1 Tax=Seminavis robusta TaxID=568900 RepID=A0A9N8HPS7_9STRA|nr:EEF1A lysine methyltransferase 3 [Seminavis robusta]|eukprot:Sro1204_g252230.1 EEF1A lysine methyltransferase 3 (315) ;mRNA; f:26009-26953
MTTAMEMCSTVEYDAAEAMFNRGAYLRKLRELEAQDEAERQQEAAVDQSTVDCDTLHYESQYLNAGQQYYDDYKHVNYKFIDFGYINSDDNMNNKENSPQEEKKEEAGFQELPLMIEQDRSLKTKGGFVWDAGYILAEHVIHEQDEWKQLQHGKHGKPVRMVELGAGTGITGLMVASGMPESVHMSLTDLPSLMPLLQRNLERNQSSAGGRLQATAFPLAWGTNVTGNYDVILGADVVAGIYDPIKLAKTISDLCHEKTLVYLAVNNRLAEIIATFEGAMGKLFEHVEHRAPVSRNKNPNVSIFVATGKKQCSQ